MFLVIGVGEILFGEYIQLCRNRKADLRPIKCTIMLLLCMQVEACLDASCPVSGVGFWAALGKVLGTRKEDTR